MNITPPIKPPRGIKPTKETVGKSYNYGKLNLSSIRDQNIVEYILRYFVCLAERFADLSDPCFISKRNKRATRD